jgi:tetratricopeptide (TPR) repeat protein
MKSKTMALALGLILGLAVFANGQEARDWVLRAQNAYSDQNYEECAHFYRYAIEKGATHRETYYNAARCCARIGDIELAFEYLNTAMEKGYREIDQMKQDADLNILRGDVRWGDILHKCQANMDGYLASNNVALYRFYLQDQADRVGDEINWDAVAQHDAYRRDQARKMLQDGTVKTSEDYYHAAMIFQHGEEPEDYMKAHELALKAVGLDSTNDDAKWLAAAAQDRYLWSTGKPQWYGTQFQIIDDKWTIDPIDTTQVTDEERAEWHVPSLKEARSRAELMNQ